jgi:Fe-S-cluster formation regulator IscX/YfhJ
MRAEKESKKRVNRSRTRSIEHYQAEIVDAPLYLTDLKSNLKANSFLGGVIRVPLVSEIVNLSMDVVDMRWAEIHFLEEAIQMMQNEKIDQNLIDSMQECVQTLKWEMDGKNVSKDALPAIDPSTRNFVDISTWLCFYYEMIHDNLHRIVDLYSWMQMLTKPQRKELKKYEKKADEIMEKFENNVKALKLEGDSLRNYKKCRDDIKKNCSSCN